MIKAFDPIPHSINHYTSHSRLNERESVCSIFSHFISIIPIVAMIILREYAFYLSIDFLLFETIIRHFSYGVFILNVNL